MSPHQFLIVALGATSYVVVVCLFVDWLLKLGRKPAASARISYPTGGKLTEVKLQAELPIFLMQPFSLESIQIHSFPIGAILILHYEMGLTSKTSMVLKSTGRHSQGGCHFPCNGGLSTEEFSWVEARVVVNGEIHCSFKIGVVRSPLELQDAA